jgi:hypothetical protein
VVLARARATVLEETYGLISYQEQVMEISKQLGGFSGAEADDMRKAMGKLYRIKGGTAARDYMKKYEEKWFEGCRSTRHRPQDRRRDLAQAPAVRLLRLQQEPLGASYALQAYQDMWLKMKYPLEFYAACLTYEEDDDKKMIGIREARSRGIKILPPSVNTSNIGWTVDGDALRMGLQSINGVGEKGAAAIVLERAYGDFDERRRVPPARSGQGDQRQGHGGARSRPVRSTASAREMASIPRQIANWEKARLGMSLTVAGGAEKYASSCARTSTRRTSAPRSQRAPTSSSAARSRRSRRR